ncbi:MAG: response regulator [Planctomycetota bacterium]
MEEQTKFHILVVEDTDAQRKILVKILSQRGFKVTEASNGQKAIDILKESPEQIDAVLLDIMMPELSGTDVLDILEREHIIPELPVIVLTAMSDPQLLVTCLEKGAADFLNKPYRPEEVLSRVHAHARAYRLSLTLQKMAIENTQQTIAAGMADTLNNRTMAVKGFGELLLDKVDKHINGEQNIAMDEYNISKSKYYKAVDYLTSAINEFVEYSSGLAKTYLDIISLKDILNPIIDSNSAAFDVTCIGDVDSLPTVGGDTRKLSNCFNEIFANACDAADANLKVELSFEESDEYVTVSIKDNGKGMDKKTLDASCLPFFSTKGTSRTGLIGLWSTMQYLRSISGDLLIDSEEGKGTTVSVKLPKMG